MFEKHRANAKDFSYRYLLLTVVTPQDLLRKWENFMPITKSFCRGAHCRRKQGVATRFVVHPLRAFHIREDCDSRIATLKFSIDLVITRR